MPVVPEFGYDLLISGGMLPQQEIIPTGGVVERVAVGEDDVGGFDNRRGCLNTVLVGRISDHNFHIHDSITWPSNGLLRLSTLFLETPVAPNR
jgi:hypothetical protein